MTWLYQNKEFVENDIGKAYGFVYCITNLQNGKKYIGKKFFTKSSYTQKKGKRRKSRKNSDWLSYWGSSKSLTEDFDTIGKENFKREILHLCYSRSECAYLELREQIDNRVLESDNWYNDWIMVRIRKCHIIKVNTDTYNISEEEIALNGKKV